MVDANYRICGFIVLLNTQRAVDFDAEMKTRPPCSISGKIYRHKIQLRNKLSFAPNDFGKHPGQHGNRHLCKRFFNHDILYANKSMTVCTGEFPDFWAINAGKCSSLAMWPCEFCPSEKLIDEHGNPTKVYSWIISGL